MVPIVKAESMNRPELSEGPSLFRTKNYLVSTKVDDNGYLTDLYLYKISDSTFSTWTIPYASTGLQNPKIHVIEGTDIVYLFGDTRSNPCVRFDIANKTMIDYLSTFGTSGSSITSFWSDDTYIVITRDRQLDIYNRSNKGYYKDKGESVYNIIGRINSRIYYIRKWNSYAQIHAYNIETNTIEDVTASWNCAGASFSVKTEHYNNTLYIVLYASSNKWIVYTIKYSSPTSATKVQEHTYSGGINALHLRNGNLFFMSSYNILREWNIDKKSIVRNIDLPSIAPSESNEVELHVTDKYIYIIHILKSGYSGSDHALSASVIMQYKIDTNNVKFILPGVAESIWVGYNSYIFFVDRVMYLINRLTSGNGIAAKGQYKLTISAKAILLSVNDAI